MILKAEGTERESVLRALFDLEPEKGHQAWRMQLLEKKYPSFSLFLPVRLLLVSSLGQTSLEISRQGSPWEEICWDHPPGHREGLAMDLGKDVQQMVILLLFYFLRHLLIVLTCLYIRMDKFSPVFYLSEFFPIFSVLGDLYLPFPLLFLNSHVLPVSCFPGGSVVKNLSASTGDLGSVPGLGRSPGFLPG